MLLSMALLESTGTTTEADPFTTEVVRGTVKAITDEMKVTLHRTAYSAIIYEMEDFTVGLYDADGNTISFGLGLPMWLSGLASAIKMKIEHWGKENIHPGDILLTSANEVHGSHLNHMIFTLPVFNDGELVAFSASMAHWPDVGGMLGAGVTRDIYSEGFQMPFVKAYKRGVMDEEIFEMIKINCRFPDIAMGDCRAQLATIRTGERRARALVEKVGNDVWRSALNHIYDQSERIARQAVREIPDGVYEAEQFLDHDGINLAQPIPVRVKIIVEGDEMTVDLSQMPPPVVGNINCGMTAGLSGAQVGFKTLTTPTLLPINDGAMRPLTVILPEGTIISAPKAAAMRNWMAVPDTIVDTMWKALTPAMPGRGAAGHHGLLNVGIGIGNRFDANGQIINLRGANAGSMTGGGWGAVCDADGQPATICINDGDTHAAPTEGGEAKSPDIVLERMLWQDSGGAGKFRGGLGAYQRIETRYAADLFGGGGMSREKCPPFGIFGGKDAPAQKRAYRRKTETEDHRIVAGEPPVRLSPGDNVVVYQAGGGGFGDPLERDPQKVLADARNEYISVEAAERDYGVVIHRGGPHNRTFTLDEAATTALRAQRRGARAE